MTNRTQRNVIEFILDKLGWWKEGMDSFVTLRTELKMGCEELESIEGWLTPEEARELNEHMSGLLEFITKLK